MFVFQSGKAGGFLSPTAFIVKDQEQEKKFSFCLLESLKVASSQPLLQVTPSHPYLFLLCVLCCHPYASRSFPLTQWFVGSNLAFIIHVLIVLWVLDEGNQAALFLLTPSSSGVSGPTAAVGQFSNT